MTDNQTPIATLLEKAQEYTQTTVDLFKLNAVDKSAEVVSSLVSRLAVIITVFISLLIINIGLALWIGKLLGDYYYGFFVIGISYALIAVLLHIFRDEWIKFPVSNSIIKQMLKEKVKTK